LADNSAASSGPADLLIKASPGGRAKRPAALADRFIMLVRYALYPGFLHFRNAEAVLAVMTSVTRGWSIVPAQRDPGPAFITVSADRDGFCIAEEQCEPFFEPTAVSAACSLITILLNRMIEGQAHLLCLHAGAVEIDGQAIIFPATHRAGKSTLMAALCLSGCGLIADDIVPLDCTEGPMQTFAAGVAPRLRLPLPASLGMPFRLAAWLHAGPDDGYYRYLRLPPARLRAFGQRTAIGAFIFLEREEACHECRLLAVDRADAIRILLLQNFGVAAPPDIILERMETLTSTIPAFLLRYRSLRQAATSIGRIFANRQRAAALWQHLEKGAPDLKRIAKCDDAAAACLRDRHIRECRVVRCAHAVFREAGGAQFLVDQDTGAIFALDVLGTAIWQMMQEPVCVADMAEAIGKLYPDINPERIAGDTESLVNALIAQKLAMVCAGPTEPTA
jgi:hypothetical protein